MTARGRRNSVAVGTSKALRSSTPPRAAPYAHSKSSPTSGSWRATTSRFRIEVPDDLRRTVVDVGDLPEHWDAAEPTDATREVGTKWAAAGETAILEVPSGRDPARADLPSQSAACGFRPHPLLGSRAIPIRSQIGKAIIRTHPLLRTPLLARPVGADGSVREAMRVRVGEEFWDEVKENGSPGLLFSCSRKRRSRRSLTPRTAPVRRRWGQRVPPARASLPGCAPARGRRGTGCCAARDSTAQA